MPNDAPAAQALSKAKVKLMLKPNCAFFATLILQAPTHWITADEVPTAATDGINLFVNPEFFLGLDADERVFLVLHEVMHNVYNHVTRRGFRDPKIWNKACDYVINGELIARGFKMPPKGLHDTNYNGMSADEVYEVIKNESDKGNDGPPCPWEDIQSPPPPDGDGGDGTGPTGIGGVPQPNAQAVEDHNKNLLTTATQASQQSGDKAGTIPGNLQRTLEDMLYPKLPWDKILAKFLFSLAKNDFSWRRPSRRFLSQGMIMPSMYSEGVGKIDFAIDTSGSVSEADFNQFRSELQTIFETFQPENIGVIQFDDQIRSNRRVCNLEEFAEIQFQGGGGTNVYPVLQDFEESEGKALVFLTDGFFHHGESMKPSKPVIWAIYDNPNFVPAFGDVIHFNKDELYDN